MYLLTVLVVMLCLIAFKWLQYSCTAPLSPQMQTLRGAMATSCLYIAMHVNLLPCDKEPK